ncbi:PTS sugar transporter subunit IIC [uncultured Anaerococcus sp.]|uniref:PTS sugar transporter subunit IIC n=1 Tax=uncultured Anaerococcus sp. TaxID=293428 RepID=UPI002638F077|nr:PTS transporter subunit EIIC [uncultured Anaerococcus sp.]
MTESNERSFQDRFTEAAMKFGAEVHLRSLRDAFSIMMPLFILAGLAVLINSVIFPKILSESSLETAGYWANSIANATLNVSGLILCGIIGYTLSRNKGYANPYTCVMIALASLVVMMPQTLNIVATNEMEFEATGYLSFENLGTTSMFAGIIIGLLSTELYLKLSEVEKLKVNIGGDVPPQVNASFNNMIPAMLTIVIFSLVSFLLNFLFGTDLITLITTSIQEPLRKINTSLLGTVILYSLGNLLFTFGIHQTVIYGTILEPLLLVNMNENMAAAAAGKEIPYIINSTFVPTFGMLGGSGSTICLLIALFLFYRNNEQYKELSKLAIAPGIFNINEPVIFGFPIVFNLPMIIPFVLTPAIGLIIAYFATSIGFMNRCTVLVPWTTPPLLNGFLATGGDKRAIIVQLLIIILGVMLYIPFIKVSERVTKRQAEAQSSSEI